jgi:hypothetical protein
MIPFNPFQSLRYLSEERILVPEVKQALKDWAKVEPILKQYGLHLRK